MAKLSADEVLTAIGEMSVIELVELKKMFEEKFDVTAAAAPVMMAAGGAPADGGDDAGAEKSDFTVTITSGGDKKIQVIKEVRALTSLGLKEAKDLVEGAPNPVLEGISKEDADKAKEQLEAAGAGVEVA